MCAKITDFFKRVVPSEESVRVNSPSQPDFPNGIATTSGEKDALLHATEADQSVILGL